MNAEHNNIDFDNIDSAEAEGEEGEHDEECEAEIDEEDDQASNQAEKELEKLAGSAGLEIDDSFLADKERRLKEAIDFRTQQHRKGVIYFPSLPPYMSPNTIRRLLDKFSIERIYLSPEAEHKRKIRVKKGGNRKIKYTEGWVEFSSKKTAKQVAECLNGQLIGGKKRHNLFRDDVWIIRYLPKFKWENLKEKFEYDRKVREERLKMSLSQTRREQNFYLSNVEPSKRMHHINERKNKRERKDEEKENSENDNEDKSDDQSNDEEEHLPRKNFENKKKDKKFHKRIINQKQPIVKYSRTKE